MPFYDYICKSCGKILADSENPGPPLCELCGRLMERKFTPVNFSVRGASINARERREARWAAEREADQKEEEANKRQIQQDTEKWKREYVGNEMHVKFGNPHEPETREFKLAGKVPRSKRGYDYAFEKRKGQE